MRPWSRSWRVILMPILAHCPGSDPRGPLPSPDAPRLGDVTPERTATRTFARTFSFLEQMVFLFHFSPLVRVGGRRLLLDDRLPLLGEVGVQLRPFLLSVGHIV